MSAKVANDLPVSLMNSGLARNQFNANRDLLVQRLDAVRDLRLGLGAAHHDAEPQSPYAELR